MTLCVESLSALFVSAVSSSNSSVLLFLEFAFASIFYYFFTLLTPFYNLNILAVSVITLLCVCLEITRNYVRSVTLTIVLQTSNHESGSVVGTAHAS